MNMALDVIKRHSPNVIDRAILFQKETSYKDKTIAMCTLTHFPKGAHNEQHSVLGCSVFDNSRPEEHVRDCRLVSDNKLLTAETGIAT